MDYSNIILEMLDRIKKLELEVDNLKKVQPSNVSTNDVIGEHNMSEQQSKVEYSSFAGGKRDTTRYLFEGYIYLKNRLVLAIVKAYVANNGSITCQQLKQVFDKSLQGSIGVVESVEIAKLRSDYSVRFFAKPDEVIHLSDGDMFVCTQWGIGNIINFIKRAEQLGFEIEPIKY